MTQEDLTALIAVVCIVVLGIVLFIVEKRDKNGNGKWENVPGLDTAQLEEVPH